MSFEIKPKSELNKLDSERINARRHLTNNETETQKSQERTEKLEEKSAELAATAAELTNRLQELLAAREANPDEAKLVDLKEELQNLRNAVDVIALGPLNGTAVAAILTVPLAAVSAEAFSRGDNLAGTMLALNAIASVLTTVASNIVHRRERKRLSQEIETAEAQVKDSGSED